MGAAFGNTGEAARYEAARLENERYAAARLEMAQDVAQPHSAIPIHRKPVHSVSIHPPPATAAVPSDVNPGLSSFEASTLHPNQAAAPTPSHGLGHMAHENLSSFEASTLHEKPLPTILPATKEKANDSESLENGSVETATYTAGGAKPSLVKRFDTLFPSHKKYLGRLNLTRRTFLLLLLGVLLLVVLIIGLGAGLGSKKKSKIESKPLPPGQIQTGDLTFYDTGGPGYGSCGEVHYSEDAVCAVSHLIYDSVATSGNPNENVLCGRRIRVSRVDERDGERKSVDCRVVDRCEGCKAEDVDLSPGMYNEIAAEEKGRVRGEWAWLD